MTDKSKMNGRIDEIRVTFNGVSDVFLSKLLFWLQNEVPLNMMPTQPQIKVVKLEKK